MVQKDKGRKLAQQNEYPAKKIGVRIAMVSIYLCSEKINGNLRFTNSKFTNFMMFFVELYELDR